MVHRVFLPVQLEFSAAGENRLGCPLADDTVFTFGCSNYNGHDTALKVERDFIDLCVVRNLSVCLSFCMR